VEITTAEREGITVVYPAGRIDTVSAPELEHVIHHILEDGKRKILLDFSAVSYISSSGLRVLLAAAKRLRDPGDRYGLCCLSADVHKIIRLAGFTSIFSIFSSEGEALAGWR
jgi:anti-sigma B factor antagonist